MERLFLDDIRIPIECSRYMHLHIGDEVDEYLGSWKIVRSYREFVEYIENNEMPDLISFDHDLSREHYKIDSRSNPHAYDNCEEKTGYECLKWLLSYCVETGKKIPKCLFHTMNPVGLERMESYLNFFIKKS